MAIAVLSKETALLYLPAVLLLFCSGPTGATAASR